MSARLVRTCSKQVPLRSSPVSFHELSSETDGMEVQIDGTIMRVQWLKYPEKDRENTSNHSSDPTTNPYYPLPPPAVFTIHSQSGLSITDGSISPLRTSRRSRT